MDFCDQCESTQRGSVGPSSSQLMCLKGNYHWCCFPLLSGQRASRSCHGRPATQDELPSGPHRYQRGTETAKRTARSGGRREGKTTRLVGRAESNYPLSGSLRLIATPIKAGNTAYWFTPLNTHYKQIQREYIMCKFTHKWVSHPHNIYIISSRAPCTPIILAC